MKIARREEILIVCHRCQEIYTLGRLLEVSALEKDVKETKFTICKEIGEHIIVCQQCATSSELLEDNYI